MGMTKKRARRRGEARKLARAAREPIEPPVDGPMREEHLQGYGFFKKIRGVLQCLHPETEQQNRKLFYDDYAALMLFYFFNPIITSLRGMQAVSDMPKVRKKLGIRRVSLGSLSESVRLFDPELLREVLTVADGSILPALPRMAWAVWLRDEHRGVKLHVQLEVLKDTAVRAELTPGKTGETRRLEANLEPGRLYVLDRAYHDHALLGRIVKGDSSFVVRLHSDAAYEVLQEKRLTDQARRAGVVWDRIVRLGSTDQLREKLAVPVRLVKIHVPARQGRGRGYVRKKVDCNSKSKRVEPGQPYDMLLGTSRVDLEADIIALIYRHRWKVELFFRMVKCLMGCRHLVSESPEGVTIQVYCALIAALLLAQHTGRRVNKRTFEITAMYLAGWCTADEAIEMVEKYAPGRKTQEG